MGNLQVEVERLRREVSEFKESLELLETPQRYEPKIGELLALDYLRSQVRAAKGVEERERLSRMSRQTLADAEKRLASKEEELSQLEADCEAIANEMRSAGEVVLAAQLAYQESLKNFESLAVKYQRRWQQLNPNQELYRKLGQVEFPGFATLGVCGILTSDAIARDLR
jgi:hypothetical protein